MFLMSTNTETTGGASRYNSRALWSGMAHLPALTNPMDGSTPATAQRGCVLADTPQPQRGGVDKNAERPLSAPSFWQPLPIILLPQEKNLRGSSVLDLPDSVTLQATN